MNKQDLSVLEKVLKETEEGGTFSVEISGTDNESRETLSHFLQTNYAIHIQTHNKATLKSWIAEWYVKGRKLFIHCYD